MPRIDLGEYGDTLFDKGIPGMEVDINVSSIANYNNGETPLDFGIAVTIDGDGNVQLPTATSEIAGAVVRHAVFDADSNGETRYSAYMPIPVMEFGRIWTYCKDGCSVGDAVSCDTDGSWSAAGGAISVPGAFWDSKAAAGEIAILRLNRSKAAAPVADGGGTESAKAPASDTGTSGTSGT
jgi:hypothetical protein